MSTLTATVDSARAQVRLDLDFSDIDAPYVYVTRIDAATGAPTAVRGHGASTTIGGLAYAPMFAGYRATLYDTEVPLDTAVSYSATAPIATLNANPTFSAGYVDPWYVTDTAITLRITPSVSGVNYLSFFTAGATANPKVRGEDVPATAGATLAITASLSANASVTATAGLEFLDATGAILASGSSSATVLAATTVTYSAAAPANTVAVRPFLTMGGTPPATTVLSANPITVTNAAGSATSAAVTVPSLGACWLKDPVRPGSNVRVDFAFAPDPLCVPAEGVFFQSMGEEQQNANAVVLNINNQAAYAAVSKVRSLDSSTLTLVSRTFVDRDRLVTLLAPGSPLLFQVPDEYGVPDRMMSVGASTKSRVLPDHRFPLRVFSLPFNTVASPGGPMQGTSGARWSDQCNRYASWSAVTSAGLTWVNMLDGLAG